MYPKGCLSQNVAANIKIYSGSVLLKSHPFFDTDEYSFVKFDKLAAGTYTIMVSATWAPNYVKEWTLKAYAKESL